MFEDSNLPAPPCLKEVGTLKRQNAIKFCKLGEEDTSILKPSGDHPTGSLSPSQDMSTAQSCSPQDSSHANATKHSDGKLLLVYSMSSSSYIFVVVSLELVGQGI